MWEQFSSPPLPALTWRGVAEEIGKGTVWFSASDKQHGNSYSPEIKKAAYEKPLPKEGKAQSEDTPPMKTSPAHFLWSHDFMWSIRIYRAFALYVNKELVFKLQAQILRELEIFILCFKALFRVQEQIKLPYRYEKMIYFGWILSNHTSEEGQAQPKSSVSSVHTWLSLASAKVFNDTIRRGRKQCTVQNGSQWVTCSYMYNWQPQEGSMCFLWDPEFTTVGLTFFFPLFLQ